MGTFNRKEGDLGGHLTRREWLLRVGGWAAVAAFGSAMPPALAHGESLTGITTGFLELDRLLRGLKAGELIVLAARPSMGKTALALNMVEHAALSQPAWLQRKPAILYFSLEMGRQSIMRRVLCSRGMVDARREERASTDALHGLTVVADEFSRTSFYIDDTAGMTMMSLRDRARQQKAKDRAGPAGGRLPRDALLPWLGESPAGDQQHLALAEVAGARTRGADRAPRPHPASGGEVRARLQAALSRFSSTPRVSTFVLRSFVAETASKVGVPPGVPTSFARP